MLERILASVIVKVLTKFGQDFVAWLQEIARKLKRQNEQKKATEKAKKNDDKPVRDDETRKDEQDYLNS